MIFLEVKCFSFQTKSCLNTLDESKGLVPEFINPKYADEQEINLNHQQG